VPEIENTVMNDYKTLVRKLLGHKIKRIWMTPKSWHRCVLCKKTLFVSHYPTDEYQYTYTYVEGVGFLYEGRDVKPEWYCEKIRALL
jgi:hypothetical protein